MSPFRERFPPPCPAILAPHGACRAARVKAASTLWPLAALLFALAACAPLRSERPAAYAFTGKPGQLLDLGLGRVLEEGELGPRLAGARLVFLGEHHDEIESHRFQARAIRALIAQGKEVYVALEMFPPGANDALADWSRGKLEEREFLARSNWYEHWGFPWGDYRDLFLLFRDQRLPVRGINVTREQRKLAGEGTLAPELKEEVGDLDLTVEPQRVYLADTLNEVGHGDGMTSLGSPEFERFLRIQVLWDHVMGTRAAQLTRAGSSQQVVVVLIGAGHLEHKLGANMRAARARPDVAQLTVVERLVAAREVRPDTRVTIPIGLADIVRVGAYHDDDEKPGSLSALKLSAAEGGVRVDAVRALAPSPMRAFQEGDLIESLNGKAFHDPIDLRLAYETFPPGSTAHWMVRREGLPVPMDLPIKGKD